MIPYQQLCAALDRYNNVPSAQAEEAVLAVSTGDVQVIEEAAIMEEAAVIEEAAVVEAADVVEEAIVSSDGENAAAAAGFIGGDPSPEPVVPSEGAIQVEPALGDNRLDHTDEVSLDDVEMVGDSGSEDPNAQG